MAPVTPEVVHGFIKKTLEYYELDDQARSAHRTMYNSGAQAMQVIRKSDPWGFHH